MATVVKRVTIQIYTNNICMVDLFFKMTYNDTTYIRFY